MKPASKTFHATLERINSPLKWVMARIPFDSGKLWGKRGQIRVKGEINGFAFRSTLFPDGAGAHRLLVTKAMQRSAKTAPGMTARFRLAPDAAERRVAVPAELTRALSEDRSLRRWFEGLSPSIRNEFHRGVSSLKNPAARVRRARQTAEILLSAKEAERELPPALQIALMQRPLARAGWQMMSPAQRRRHLLGIFYYRSVDARNRRIAVAVEDAVQFARRKKIRRNSPRTVSWRPDLRSAGGSGWRSGLQPRRYRESKRALAPEASGPEGLSIPQRHVRPT